MALAEEVAARHILPLRTGQTAVAARRERVRSILSPALRLLQEPTPSATLEARQEQTRVELAERAQARLSRGMADRRLRELVDSVAWEKFTKAPLR